MAQQQDISFISSGLCKLFLFPSAPFLKGAEAMWKASHKKLDKAIEWAEDIQHGKMAFVGYPIGRVVEGLSRGFRGGLRPFADVELNDLAVPLVGSIITSTLTVVLSIQNIQDGTPGPHAMAAILRALGAGYAAIHVGFIATSAAIPLALGVMGGMLGMCSGIINFGVGLERAKQARLGVVTNPKFIQPSPQSVSMPLPPTAQEKIDSIVTSAAVVLNDPNFTDEDRKAFAEKLSEKFPGLFEPPAKQPDPIDMRAPHDMVVKPLVLRRSRQSSAV